MTDLEGRAFTRRGFTLVPSDRFAVEWLRELKDGREVIVTVRKARNPKHHRKAFALLKIAMDADDRWPSLDALLDDLKEATRVGHYAENKITGETRFVPGSISFSAMDQIAFNRWFRRALWVLSQVLSVLPEELEREVDEALK